ncbi:MAG: hypothetical protein ACLPKI_16540 [Streptosporangiaceae bacterium]
MWKRDFRLKGSELYETLTSIRSNAENLFKKMDRLCEGPRSYLAVSLGKLPAKTQAYYAEFLVAYDGICDVLREYIAYANHYNVRYKIGERPDTKPPLPPEMREDLFGKLNLLEEALRNLAESLEDQSAGTTDVGQDATDGPGRRSA